MVLGSRDDSNWDEPTDTESVNVAQKTPSIPSIAVLPSVNMGGAENYVSDGVAEEILNRLIPMSVARVIHRVKKNFRWGRFPPFAALYSSRLETPLDTG